MNFVIDLAHRGISVVQWTEHRSTESEGLMFDSSWGLRIFPLSHAREKTKKHLFLYFSLKKMTHMRCYTSVIVLFLIMSMVMHQ